MKVDRRFSGNIALQKILRTLIERNIDFVDNETLASMFGLSYPAADRYMNVLSKSFKLPIVTVSKKKLLLIKRDLVKKFPPSAIVRK